MRDDPENTLRRQSVCSDGYHKSCWFIETAVRWPWKSESSKECVTTHLPNGLVLKMDGAEADCRYVFLTICMVKCRRMWREYRSLVVKPGGTHL